jgi:hypothetical protein
MELNKENTFDAPIPGMSLTTELGNRPWQSPPQFTTADEVADYYMERMSNEDFMLQIVDVLEMGVPITVLANTIQMANVMDGVHTIDTGMLALPLIMEMMMMLGDSAGIKYDTGLDNPKKTRDTLLHKFAMEYEKKLENMEEDLKDRPEEPVEMEEVKEPTGLMARRK